MKRVFSFVTALVLLLVMCPICPQAAAPEDFTGIVLTAPADVTVKFYTGYTDGTLLTPDYTETGDINAYYYSVASGKYRYVVSGKGYYSITKCVYVSAAEAAVKTVLDVTPGKKAGTGWETGTAQYYSDEAIALALNDDISQWPEYADVFTTPWFTKPHAGHQMTTQQEMLDFIRPLDDDNDRMYILSAGTSGSGEFDIPVVFFTEADLTGVTTIQEAAEKIGQEKPTILHRAQVHGNEPAAGEAALAIIQRLDGTYGDEVLGTINYCIFPRMSPDGAYNYQRYLVTGDDPNRDHLRVRNPETVAFLQALQHLEPEVFIDGHEYALSTGAAYLTDGDITISTGHSLVNSADFAQTGIDMILDTFDAMEANGLNYRFYSQCINGYNPNVGGQFVSRQGTLFFLLESRGIRAGMSHFSRRVISHVISTENIIDYVVENADEIQQLVANERAQFIAKGATYEESDQVILSTGGREDTDYTYTMNRYYQNGVKNTLEVTPEAYDILLRSRTAPTAYVIAAGQSYTQQVLDLMNKQGISYSFLPADSWVKLQQYVGSTEEASLTDETAFCFPEGAYVFCKNQVRSNTLSMLMEPDVTDASANNGTLAQQGILAATDGVFPIYRYIHDLNEQGTIDLLDPTDIPAAPTGLKTNNPTALGQTGSISGLNKQAAYEYRAEGDAEYTKVPTGKTSITGLEPGVYHVRLQSVGPFLPSADAIVTIRYADVRECVVYLDSTTADGGNGYSKASAVNTIEAAYSQLEKAKTYAPADATAKIVIVGTYTLVDAPTILPTHTFPVTITGATPADGLDYATTNTSQTARRIEFHGPTTLENMTVTYSSSQSISSFCAMGNPFTVGQNVTTVPNSRGVHFNVMGGAYIKTQTVASTNLTLLSGTWRGVYANGFNGNLTGDANLTIDGADVTTYLQTGYAGSIGGKVNISLTNTSVGVGLYCGNTNSGDLTGDVTLTLGENVDCSVIRAGSRDQGNLTGTVTVILDGADVSAAAFSGECENVDGLGSTVNKSILVLKSGKLGAFSDFDEVRVDTSAGGALTATQALTATSVTGGGTVTLEDGATLTVTGAISGMTGVSAENGTQGSVCVQAPTATADTAFVYNGNGLFTVSQSDSEKVWTLGDATGATASVSTGSFRYYARSLGEAIASCPAGSTVTLLANSTESPSVTQDILLDLNGHSISGTVTAQPNVTLSCMDSATADYDISDGVYGKITKVSGDVTGAEASADRDVYLMAEEADGISFHAVGINISTMRLRAADVGLSFVSSFNGDSKVKERVLSYGVALSVTGAPDEETLSNPLHFTRFDGETFGTDSSVTGTLLYGVMKSGNSYLTNRANSSRQVYGRAFVQIGENEYLFGNARSRSLREQVEGIDSQKWEELDDTQRSEIIALYNEYPTVMNGWNIPNLKAAANAAS